MAISPLDGRYAAQVEKATAYFSEYALIRYRLYVELHYLKALVNTNLRGMLVSDPEVYDALDNIYEKFNVEAALEIKRIEKTTAHDIKALEYFLHAKLQQAGIGELIPLVHFCLTSQDINNTAIPLQVKDYLLTVWQPELQAFVNQLHAQAKGWAKLPMLARTHGQPASPTTLGKEMMVFVARLEGQLKLLTQLPHQGKFGGATGNYNAHFAAYPDYDWLTFGDELLQSMGLERIQFTTQIDPYDGLAARLHAIMRINTILIDFARDMWAYISVNYFALPAKPGEVGSSAMPHKVNPIDFENAEGNLGVANALLGFMADKLPVSRLQRDLTDSTVLRNLGVALCHSQLAISSIARGFAKCIPVEARITHDLQDHAIVLAEAYQVILRREGLADGYERLKAATRGGAPTLADLHAFVHTLPVTQDVKEELLALRPETYIGRAPAY